MSSVRVLLVAEVRVREDGHLRQDVQRRQDERLHDALVEPAAVVKAGHRGGEVTGQAELTHSGDMREETHFERAFCQYQVLG